MPNPDGLPSDLIYVSDTTPGIRRRRRGKGFSYVHDDATPLDKSAIARIQKLGIPPAYRDVWICGLPEGHIQATGYDAKGRKQYLYHQDWSQWRAGVKYNSLAEFGCALGRLRRRVLKDLQAQAGDLTFSLAALTLLIDRTCLRVGNESYAESNKTFGAATLLTRHLTLGEDTIQLRFTAKGGKKVTHTLRDKRLHRILQEIGDLPGRKLFTWLTETGEVRAVNSQDVNAYIADASGLSGATAKTFRTWGGSLTAFEVARQATDKLTVKMMAEASAARLQNTPTISRSAYIHPAILGLAKVPAAERISLLAAVEPNGDPALKAEERRVLGFLLRPPEQPDVLER